MGYFVEMSVDSSNLRFFDMTATKLKMYAYGANTVLSVDIGISETEGKVSLRRRFDVEA